MAAKPLPTVALECFGLIILEAWAVGCPVLGTDVGAIPELLRPVTPDFLVPPRDARRLREKAEAFLDGRLVPPPPEELVRHVEESYGRDAVGGRLLDLLEGVAARPCRAPQASGATAGTGP